MHTISLILSAVGVVSLGIYGFYAWCGFCRTSAALQVRVFLAWQVRAAAVGVAAAVLALGMALGGAPTAAGMILAGGLGVVLGLPASALMVTLARRGRGQLSNARRRLIKGRTKRIKRRPARRWVRRGVELQPHPELSSLPEPSRSSVAS